MKVYIVKIQVPYEGTLEDIVYTVEEEAKKHVYAYNNDSSRRPGDSDLYAEYYVRELKDKFMGL